MKKPSYTLKCCVKYVIYLFGCVSYFNIRNMLALSYINYAYDYEKELFKDYIKMQHKPVRIFYINNLKKILPYQFSMYEYTDISDVKIFDLSKRKRKVIFNTYNENKYDIIENHFLSDNIRKYFDDILYPKNYRVRVTIKDLIKSFYIEE